MRLKLHGITKRFGDRTVLDAISADLSDARCLALIGPSGGGKSTLLRILAGLETAEAGSASVDGRPISTAREWRKSVGVVFQAFNLFPHLTALENVALPLVHVHGVPRAEAAERALAALRRFRLDDHAAHKPAALSGGQKQRVAIARAIATGPRLLLFDEPTSALDPEMTAEVLDAIQELKDEGRDLVLVTHQMGFARAVSDSVAFLSGGRLSEIAPPESLFASPQTESCRSFLARVLKY